MKTPVLSIIIPTYNEQATIASILDAVFSSPLPVGFDREVIVINDCSNDSTETIVHNYMQGRSEHQIKYIRHNRNMGKGAAIRSGIKEATGDYVIIQDADMEYDPEEYIHLLKPILRGQADVVYGSRLIGGNPHRILFFWHSIGNKFLTFLSNAASNLNMSDMESCYKLFRREIIQNIKLRENKFGFEPEITAKISRINGIRIYEVGISYYGRTYGEGKKINWKDGFGAIWCILKYGFLRRD